MKKILILLLFISITTECRSQSKIDTANNVVSNVVSNVLYYGQIRLDSAILKFTNDWLYKPYVYGGDSTNGIDCSHLNLKFLKEVFYVTVFGSCREQWSQFKKVSKSNILPGDLVFFRSKQSPSGWHCGTYIGDGQFIHAANRKDGVKISDLNSGDYKKNFKGAVRVK
jgi:probable lipoprotein NlpC